MSENAAYNHALQLMHSVRTELDRAINCMMNGRNIEAGICLETARYKARDYELELAGLEQSSLSDEEVSE